MTGAFRLECIRTRIFHPGPYCGVTEVEYATAGGVDWSSNQRLHTSLDMMAQWS